MGQRRNLLGQRTHVGYACVKPVRLPLEPGRAGDGFSDLIGAGRASQDDGLRSVLGWGCLDVSWAAEIALEQHVTVLGRERLLRGPHRVPVHGLPEKRLGGHVSANVLRACLVATGQRADVAQPGRGMLVVQGAPKLGVTPAGPSPAHDAR
jgi:hypothetical protein